EERYQTVYADSQGSVAAPTAGLHFTRTVLEKLQQKVDIENITLHVGAGTFKPVKTDTMEQHEMHAEFIDVNISTIKKIAQYTNRFITAVGTTSLRTIESLYWMGVKILVAKSNSPHDLMIHQWDPYELARKNINSSEAINALLQWMMNNNLSRVITKTQILIAPGYEMKLTNALVTNFHQPKSTLLLLVAAFAGEDWRKVYDYALRNDFRFLSYGDGCLLFRNDSFP
ncbi:MAG TPA: S-adenosylmethionine:tRNA ribosyltransferase-isomerase, partial [Flavitalea sp.]|nr:S-adenosylmethionine:tRNA ribosyltransferase-isomerase [Flavitalea sp.]